MLNPFGYHRKKIDSYWTELYQIPHRVIENDEY